MLLPKRAQVADEPPAYAAKLSAEAANDSLSIALSLRTSIPKSLNFASNRHNKISNLQGTIGDGQTAASLHRNAALCFPFQSKPEPKTLSTGGSRSPPSIWNRRAWSKR
jgi:hypothetical protein